MQLPAALLPHAITVRAYRGTGPYGDVFGDPVTLRAFVENRRRLVVSTGGEEVISEATVYTDPGPDLPVPGRVDGNRLAGHRTSGPPT